MPTNENTKHLDNQQLRESIAHVHGQPNQEHIEALHKAIEPLLATLNQEISSYKDNSGATHEFEISDKKRANPLEIILQDKNSLPFLNGQPWGIMLSPNPPEGESCYKFVLYTNQVPMGIGTCAEDLMKTDEFCKSSANFLLESVEPAIADKNKSQGVW